jgi:hypothetical protein
MSPAKNLDVKVRVKEEVFFGWWECQFFIEKLSAVL